MARPSAPPPLARRTKHRARLMISAADKAIAGRDRKLIGAFPSWSNEFFCSFKFSL